MITEPVVQPLVMEHVTPCAPSCQAIRSVFKRPYDEADATKAELLVNLGLSDAARDRAEAQLDAVPNWVLRLCWRVWGK